MMTFLQITVVSSLLALVSAAPTCEFLCLLDLQAVCGTDGVTYPSECDLQTSNCVRPSNDQVGVAYIGECSTPGPCDFLCFLDLQAVCGTDGVTYANECDIDVFNCLYPSNDPVGVAYIGECSTPGPCDFLCFLDLQAVCGTDGVTYPSECDLDVFNCLNPSNDPVGVAYIGDCLPSSSSESEESSSESEESSSEASGSSS